MFDIKDFYPSIKEKLLWEAIRFAKLYISTTNKDIEAIFHARKFLLYYNDEPWVKNGESNFDVSIGSYDGALAYALIGIFMLSLLSKYINKNRFGLHKDDGLAILKNTSSLEAEKLNKKYQKLFKEIELDIIIQYNLKITIYLDITLNLNDGSYRPYRKPDEETSYIHINSDHPPSIIKEIPQSIEKRLSILPSSKDIFQESAIYYEKCLKTVDIKPSYNINNQKKTIKTKRKENVPLFGSIYHIASPLKPISGEYSSN